MSWRDATGGTAANYVLPSTTGAVGDYLAVSGTLTNGLNSLVWAAPHGGDVQDTWQYAVDSTIGEPTLLRPDPLAPGYADNANFAVPGSATSVDGGGSRMMFLPGSGAFRAGFLAPGSTAWNAANRGDGSAAFGADCKASGVCSVAAGTSCSAQGENAVALGSVGVVGADAARSSVLGGGGNEIHGCSDSAVVTGINNQVLTHEPGASAILAGAANRVTGGACAVVAGNGNEVRASCDSCAIVSGESSILTGSTTSAIVAGNGNTIGAVTSGCILAGDSGAIGNGCDRCSILAGTEVVATPDQTDTAYCQRLATRGGRQKATREIVVSTDTLRTLGLDDHVVALGIATSTPGVTLEVYLPNPPVVGQEYWVSTVTNLREEALTIQLIATPNAFLSDNGIPQSSLDMSKPGLGLHLVWEAGYWVMLSLTGNGAGSGISAWQYASDALAATIVGDDAPPALTLHPSPGFPGAGRYNFLVTDDPTDTPSVEGPGNKMMFTGGDAATGRSFAFRAGTVTGTQWDAASRGAQSCAVGLDVTASGAQSCAIGASNAVLGNFSCAVGGAEHDLAGGAIQSGVLAGYNNAINTATNSGVLAGQNHVVGADEACVIGGHGVTVSAGCHRAVVLGGAGLTTAAGLSDTTFCARLQSSGGRQKKVTRVTTTGTVIGLDDHVVLLDNALGATLTISLPAAPVAGQEYWVKVTQALIGAGHNQLLGNGHLIQTAAGGSVTDLVLDAVGTTTHVVWSAVLGEWLVLGSAGAETADVWAYVADAGSQSLVPVAGVAPATSAFVVSGSNTVGSIHGAGQKLLFTTNGSLRAGSVSGAQWDAPGAQSCALGLNTTAAAAQSLVTGSGNSVDATSQQSVCFGATNAIAGCPQSAILAGTSHEILANAAGCSAIIAGDDHTMAAARSVIGGGVSNEISAGGGDCGILAGIGGTIGVSSASAIICGNGNTVNADSAAVLCGDTGTIAAGSDRCSILSGGAITSTLNQSNTAYAQRLATRGGRQLAIATVIGSSTLTLDEHCVAFSNGTGATMTLTLPGTPVSGQTYLIKVVAVFAGPARNMLSGGANAIMDASGTSATTFDLGAAAGGAYSVVWAPTQAKWLITSTTSAGSSAQTLRYVADTSYTTLCADPTASGYVAAANFLMPPSAVSTEGLGARFMYCPNTKALRCGEITSGYNTYWDRLQRGTLSTCFGSNTQAQGQRASVLGGSLNRCNGNDGGVVSGVGNAIGSTQGFIGAGNNGQIYNTGGSRNFIVCGNNNVVSGGTCGGVCGGTGNTASVDDAAVLCGSGCSAGGLQGAVVCGTTNSSSGTNAAVLCGSTNDITYGAARSSILCGSGISATQPDTAYAARLTTLGGRQIKVRIVTATGGSATIDDHLIVFDNTTGATMVFYLPAGPPDGQLFIVKPINVAGVGFGNILDASGTLFWLQSGTTSTTINLSPVPGTPGPAVTVVYSATLPGYLQVA